MDKDSLSHMSRYCVCRVARAPRRRREVLCGETERKVGETPGMPAGQTGGAGMVEGSACPDHARVCLRIAPRRGCGRRGGRAEGQGRDHAVRAHRGAGALAGGDRMMWTGGYHAGTVGPGESATGEARPAAARREPHGVAGMPPTGARRQRPPTRRGNALS